MTLFFTIDGRWLPNGKIPGSCTVCGYADRLTADPEPHDGEVRCACGAGPLVAAAPSTPNPEPE